MSKTLKELQDDKIELQSQIESLVNKFRQKYDSPIVDIFTTEMTGSVHIKVDIEVKF